MTPIKFIFALAAASAAVSCTKQSTNPALPPAPQWMRWSAPAANFCPSPFFTNHPFLPAHGCFTHEGLVKAKYVEGKITAVAVGAETIVATSPTQWRIRLRENLKWSDGQRVRAEEVVESWRQILARCSEYPRALEIFGNVTQARAFCNHRARFSAVGIRVIDERTIAVQTTLPQPRFPLALASPAAWPFRGDKGTGPFRLQSESPSKTLRFVTNSFSLGPKPHVSGIELPAVEQTPTHRVLSFLAGEFDAVDDVPENLASTLGADPRLKTFPDPQAWFLVLGGGTSEIGQRKHLQRSIDTKESLRILRWPNTAIGRLTATDPESTEPTWAVSPTPPPLPESDIEKISAPVFRVLGSARRQPAMEELTANLTAQWTRRYGATETSSPPQTVWLVERELNPLHPEADLKLWLSLLSIGERSGRVKNRLLEASLATSENNEDETSRSAALEKLEKELVSDQALILPLFSTARTALVSPRVTGLGRDLLGNWDFANVQVDSVEP